MTHSAESASVFASASVSVSASNSSFKLTTTTTTSLLIELPTDLLLHTIRSYLLACDIFALGQCDTILLNHTQRCDLPYSHTFQLRDLVDNRWEATTMYDALTQEEQEKIMVAWISNRELRKQRRKIRPEYQIGRITGISIDNHDSVAPPLLIRHAHLLPSSIRSFKFYRNMIIRNGIRFPASLTRLFLVDFCSGEREYMMLPDGLIELEMDLPTNSGIERMQLPSRLQLLHLKGYRFNEPIEALQLPESLTELIITGAFSQSVEHIVLPSGLLKLSLEGNFNHPSFERLHLPETLTHLKLGSTFNQPCMREWIPPSSLTRLEVSSACQLSGDPISLPSSSLTFELPLDRESTHTNRNTPGPTCVNFHDHLSKVRFHREQMDMSEVIFPSSVKLIDFGPFMGSLTNWHPPPSLTELRLGYGWNLPLNKLILPATLLRLRLSGSFTQRMDDFIWPKQLEILCIATYASQLDRGLPRHLPATLKRLEMVQVNDEWMLMELPAGCVLYDTTDSIRRFFQEPFTNISKPVSHARIEKARRRATTEAMMELLRHHITSLLPKERNHDVYR